jgi:hypothetical protein
MPPSNKDGVKGPLLIFGFIAFLGFCWFTWLVVHSLNDHDVAWSRLFTTYEGCEALLIAILGAVLGGGIQEVRVRGIQKTLQHTEGQVEAISAKAEMNSKAGGTMQGMVDLLASAMALDKAKTAVQKGEEPPVRLASSELGDTIRGARTGARDAGEPDTPSRMDADAVIELMLEFAARSGWSPSNI